MRLVRTASIACALLWAACLLTPALARAEDRDAPGEDAPYDFGPRAGWHLMFGPSLGGSFGSDGGGFWLGGELALSRLQTGSWWGLYADGAWDFGHDAALITAGPQLGWLMLGLDGGVAARFAGDPDGAQLGGAARALVTFGFFALHGRYLYFPSAGEHIGQVGITLKLPVWASEVR